MKRNAYCLTTDTSQHNLNIDLTPLYIFTKDPHFAKLIKFINDGSLNVIFNFKILNNNFSI